MLQAISNNADLPFQIGWWAQGKASLPPCTPNSLISSGCLTGMARLLESFALILGLGWSEYSKSLSMEASFLLVCCYNLFSNTISEHSEGWLHLGLVSGLCFIYFLFLQSVWFIFTFNYLAPESIGSQINVYQGMHMQFITPKLSSVRKSTQNIHS